LPHAEIAQLVEHLIRNEGVAGSIPVFGTIKNQPLAGFFSVGICGVFRVPDIK
jgi:hypothetical protein